MTTNTTPLQIALGILLAIALFFGFVVQGVIIGLSVIAVADNVIQPAWHNMTRASATDALNDYGADEVVARLSLGPDTGLWAVLTSNTDPRPFCDSLSSLTTESHWYDVFPDYDPPATNEWQTIIEQGC